MSWGYLVCKREAALNGEVHISSNIYGNFLYPYSELLKSGQPSFKKARTMM